MRYISILLLAIVFLFSGCARPTDNYVYTSEEPDVQEITAEEESYPGYSKVNAPAIGQLTSGGYYVEYYNLGEEGSAKLYSIECTLERVNTLDNMYRYKPKYTLKNSDETLELRGEVIELTNTFTAELFLSVKYEPMLIKYDFYKKL